jgi:hypothetical protein
MAYTQSFMQHFKYRTFDKNGTYFDFLNNFGRLKKKLGNNGTIYFMFYTMKTKFNQF